MKSTIQNKSQLELALVQAKEGDVAMMCQLGSYYWERNEYRQSIKWYKRAYRNGNIEAMCCLGDCYRTLNKPKTAIKWYLLAIRHDYTPAKYQLATYYIEHDEYEAGCLLLEQAVEEGHLPASDYYASLLLSKGQNEDARRIYLLAAEAGAQEAWLLLGQLEERLSNDEQAIIYYQKAYDSGTDTSYVLGRIYTRLEQTSDAVHWLQIAATAGNPEAMLDLGQLLQNTDQLSDAISWIEQAARKGQPEAERLIAEAYAGMQEPQEDEDSYYNYNAVDAWSTNNGWTDRANQHPASEQPSTPDNEEESGSIEHTHKAEQMWLRMAESGDAASNFNLAVLYQEQGKVRKALEHYKIAGHNDHVEAQFRLGFYYEHQLQNPQLATYWYEKAVELGHMDAVYHLANAYYSLDKTTLALKLYRSAAKQGIPGAQYSLALMLYDLSKEDEAIIWLELSAKQAYPPALNDWAAILEDEGSCEEAFSIYEQAALLGHAEAQYNLAFLLYEQGRRDEARQWYKRSAEQGDALAQFNYAIILQQEGRLDEALAMYRAAARQNMEDSQLYLEKIGEAW